LCINGISFIRSYCTDPVCAPARSSWATGLYTSETGLSLNAGCLHEDISDIGQIMNNNDYSAFHSGKWHVIGRDVRKSFNSLYFGKVPIDAGGAEFYDSAITHATINFLSEYNSNKPFYLQVGYVNPHDVCEYLHNHENKEIPDPVEQRFLSEDQLPPLPYNFDYDNSETVIHRLARRENNAFFHKKILAATKKWSERNWRYFIWNYYRFIETVDSEIGNLLNYIEKSKFKDNTVIIFSSDHGEAAGRHKMFQKFTLYEESVRVPLIVSCLGNGVKIKKNTINTKCIISGVDIFSTILNYAYIPVPVNTHGKSFKPLVEGKETPWADYAYVESNYFGRSIITDRYKYVTEYIPKDVENFIPPRSSTNAEGNIQLFDLKEDPGEMRNLALFSGYRKIIVDLNKKLREHESGLQKRKIENAVFRNKILDWAKQLKEYRM
jgi:arylsulfatase A-like enzyme